jgi:hypothetical protein
MAAFPRSSRIPFRLRVLAPIRRRGVAEQVEDVATVLAVLPRRTTVDGCSRARVDLRIEPREGPAYVASKTVTLPVGELPRPGQRVAIRYEPRHPQRLSLALGAAGPWPCATAAGSDRLGNLERLAARRPTA